MVQMSPRFYCVVLVVLATCCLCEATMAHDAPAVTKQACMDECSQSILRYGKVYKSQVPIRFCASDGNTYTMGGFTTEMPRYSYRSNKCVLNCSVGFVHVGECACPNSCNQAYGQGRCEDVNTTITNVAERKCICRDGWKGPDCSSVDCATNNTCNGHGICNAANNPVKNIKADYCSCHKGYSGFNCAVKLSTPKLLQAPWGTMPSIFNNDTYTAQTSPSEYTPSGSSATDPYHDFHPIFTLEAVALINITVDPSELNDSFAPQNLYNSSRMHGVMDYYSTSKVTVDDFSSSPSSGSGSDVNKTRTMEIVEAGIPISFSMKGSSSRQNIKKGWKIKLRSQNDAEQRFFGVRHLGLKSGDAIQDGLVKPFLANTMLRYTATPVGRQGYASLFVNGVYYGVYYLDEFIPSEQFVENRLLDTTTVSSSWRVDQILRRSSLLKLGFGTHLQYLGDYTQNYTSEKSHIVYGPVHAILERFERKPLTSSETTDLQSYIDLVKKVGSPSEGGDYKHPWSCHTVEGREKIPLDLQTFIPGIAIEAIFLADDNFVSGNNYLLFQLGRDSTQTANTENLWQLIPHDFDRYFDWDALAKGLASPLGRVWNVSKFPLSSNWWYPWGSGHNRVTQRLFNASYWKELQHLASMSPDQQQPLDGTCFALYRDVILNLVAQSKRGGLQNTTAGSSSSSASANDDTTAAAATGGPTVSAAPLPDLYQRLGLQLAPLLKKDPSIAYMRLGEGDTFMKAVNETALMLRKRLENVTQQMAPSGAPDAGAAAVPPANDDVKSMPPFALISVITVSVVIVLVVFAIAHHRTVDSSAAKRSSGTPGGDYMGTGSEKTARKLGSDQQDDQEGGDEMNTKSLLVPV